MKYSKNLLLKAVSALVGEEQVESLGLPRATEAAAVEWLLNGEPPLSNLLVIRSALTDLRESGCFNFDASIEEFPVPDIADESIQNLNALIIRNMHSAATVQSTKLKSETGFINILQETAKGKEVAENAGLNMVSFIDNGEEEPYLMLDGQFRSDDLREIARAYDVAMELRKIGGVVC